MRNPTTLVFAAVAALLLLVSSVFVVNESQTAIVLNLGKVVRADLKPQAGKSMPVAPYGRSEAPSSAQLLETTPQATPERSVELRKRSEERLQDPFDLPPSDDE